jgi:UPF0716 protein FxsA
MIWLILIFIFIPAIEIGVFIWTSAHVGVLPIVLMILFTGIAGISLVKWQGMETWKRAQFQMYHNEMPKEELLDGICIILGGIGLLTPGFFTDTVGFLLVLPWTRRIFKPLLGIFVIKQIEKGRFFFRR